MIPVRYKKGFSLLESLVGIAIVLVAIATAFSLAPNSMYASRYARNQITASYLGLEAMEIVRHLRDSSMYYGYRNGGSDDWLALIDTGCVQDVGESSIPGCMVDAYTSTLTPCNAASGCDPVVAYPLHGQKMYGHSIGGTDTIFIRKVVVERIRNELADDQIEDNVEVQVRVEVSWNDGSKIQRVSIEENLFDWWTIKPF